VDLRVVRGVRGMATLGCPTAGYDRSQPSAAMLIELLEDAADSSLTPPAPLTHRVHILEANGGSYRLGEATGRLKQQPSSTARRA
jgi:hypothetical protein